MQILTTQEQNKLVQQSKLKDLYTNDYLNDENNENFKIISELYFNNKKDRTKLFNVGTNLFSTITDTIANFVWSPSIDIQLYLPDYTKDLVSIWKAVFWIKRTDKWLEVYHIPAETHLVSDWINKVYTLYKEIETWTTNPVYYMLRQTFTVWQIENQLFKLDNIILSEWVEVPLDTLNQTSWLSPIIQTGLDKLSIYYIQVNELNWIQSEIDRVKNLVYSLDRKAVMFETQFLWEMEQFKIFENLYIPDSAKDSDWTVSMAKLPKILATDTSLWVTWDIKYISNKNDLIQDAIAYEDTQIRKISSATSIPVDFLWLNSSWTTSWSSREIMQSAFIKKIQSYRDKLEQVLLEILELFEWEVNTEWYKITKSIVWDDIIAKNDKELIDELKIAREAGLISQYTWIQKYLKYNSQEEIERELALINNLQENGTENIIQSDEDWEDWEDIQSNS